MATIINADTSDGLKLTSDTSGQIDFQSAGSTKATIDTSGNLKFNSGFGSVGTAYGIRAWVSFNGTGTVAILNSGNVSSITDNAVGKYTVNFTTAMPDDDYSVSGTAQDTTSGSGTSAPSVTMKDDTSSITTSALIIDVVTGNGAAFMDSTFVSVQIIR